MGREVRMVPADWVHPKREAFGKETYHPMYGSSFKDAEKEWLSDFDRIRSGDMTDVERECYPNGVLEWANDETPPDPAYYMPEWKPEERTHFQMYEDTSEGTPISPVMETPEELAQWLVDNNASALGRMTASYDAWLRICKGGFAPSMVISGGVAQSGVEALADE